MLIGGLNPTGRPAQQLMELLWAQEGLEVTLTDKGKGVAQALSETAEGRRYRAKVEAQP